MAFKIKKVELVQASVPAAVHHSQIPAEVVELLDSAWAQMKEDAGLEGHVFVEDGVRGESMFMAYAKAWGMSRKLTAEGTPAKEDGSDALKLAVAKVSRKGVPDGELYFTIKPFDPNAKKPGRKAAKPEDAPAPATESAPATAPEDASVA